jgi:hypothetical protein
MTQFWVHNKICVGRWQYYLSHVLHTKGCLVLVDLSKQRWPHSLIELFCPYIWIYTWLICRQCGICLSNLHMKQTLENATAQAMGWMFLSCCFMCFGGTLTCRWHRWCVLGAWPDHASPLNTWTLEIVWLCLDCHVYVRIMHGNIVPCAI